MARLIIPGLHGSGPGHWQRLWLEFDPDARIVEQDDWDHPSLDAWLGRLGAALADGIPKVLVAHSLGAILVAHFAARRLPGLVAGALLVAPADVERCAPRHPALAGFAPLPQGPLPFPSIVVASRNDPYAAFARAAGFAYSWGSALVDAGDAGHIHVASGHGSWPDGFRLLAALTRMRPRLAA